ncbi:MAG TPA: hypothetical protein K8W20_22370 [Pseudomonas lactis]|uniref:Uncharacterized protein n=1 Tax=Pseudomonas lactis TaxID=1615674 RepID=A0A921TAK7_9PSED|nr:hypothetical protein [Pseudomonas lactis]HJH21435.1 hypothetical protein [Pseudomonas lactis]
MKIEPCKACGEAPELIDDRLVYYVRCTNHRAPWPVVYGDNHRHIDHIDDDVAAQAAIDAVDWAAAKTSAINNWNSEQMKP